MFTCSFPALHGGKRTRFIALTKPMTRNSSSSCAVASAATTVTAAVTQLRTHLRHDFPASVGPNRNKHEGVDCGWTRKTTDAPPLMRAHPSKTLLEYLGSQASPSFECIWGRLADGITRLIGLQTSTKKKVFPRLPVPQNVTPPHLLHSRLYLAPSISYMPKR